MERSDRSSTLIHGVRSGAVAGLAWGVFAAGYRTATGGTLAVGAVADTMGGFLGGMLGVFMALLMFHVVYGVILGVILAVTQKLCYKSDAIWLGGIFGAVTGVLTGNLFSFWWWEGPLGAAAGALICFVERSWFRNQYAEF